MLPSKNDHHKFKIPIDYNNFINLTGMIWISQGLLDGGTVTSFVQVFGLKIYASIAADVFFRLHNDKYTNFEPKCGFRSLIYNFVETELGNLTITDINEYHNFFDDSEVLIYWYLNF